MACDNFAQTALQSAQLELEYERSLRRTERIYDEERARILRVQLLIQEDASDELREIAEEHEDALLKSDNSAKELQDRLADIEEQYENTQIELKACMRDIDQYQAEINALNVSSSDSAKILTEKLALSRELSSLKPELDHLRSQISHHDNILADKLSLERELATAQLELDSEKRTVARLKQRSQSVDPALAEELEELKASLAKERKKVAKLERQNAKRATERSTADAELVDELESLKTELEAARARAQDADKRVREAESKTAAAASSESATLDELKKDLAKERKTSQRLEREQLKKTTEWDTQKETLESKLDAFRSKLRTTKEQLKEAQDELERREAAKYTESIAATKARMRGASIEPSVRGAPTASQANPKKRPIARFDPDMTIGTPGNGANVGKRQRLTGSMLGDKSTFSITPFLNRTAMSILPESPEDQGEEKDEHEKVDDEINMSINELAEEAEREEAQKKNEKEIPVTKKVAEKKAAPKSTTAAEKRPKATVAKGTTATTKKPALAQVPEEDDDMQETVEPEQENTIATGNKSTEPSTSISDNADTTLAQPKKKKILGPRRNIFDEDNVDNAGIGKKRIGLGLGLGAGKVKLGPGLNKPKTLAVFSPLKKDRRMTGTVGA